MKRHTPRPTRKGERSKAAAHAHDQDPVCLVRAKCGKTRLSTHVPAKDQVRFQMHYSTILKGHMDALKKKEKKEKSRKRTD
eukprot:CAMPEP_0175877024 /NCGR_PEP_ID=MMETSP0107_2-20121207/40375_1 /TAXON_ID=195067 ORGANISM="Goniomonas pacifica, Strain CCMP1869" /NCGR_SAMPLE_ID=MMETSP0107_2 /ASSEMBLY_ACC=CAM_ASM_000203 /LENGTH=80 /DNA_ID=CAMNT_0017196297 /DNA_START=23 /DNA_END=265 /DNA_ORIENTATION=+